MDKFRSMNKWKQSKKHKHKTFKFDATHTYAMQIEKNSNKTKHGIKILKFLMHFTELSRLICGSYGKVKQKEQQRQQQQ